MPKEKSLFDNIIVYIISLIKLGKDYNIPISEIYSILRHFWVSSTCWKLSFVDKLLIRLWTK